MVKKKCTSKESFQSFISFSFQELGSQPSTPGKSGIPTSAVNIIQGGSFGDQLNENWVEGSPLGHEYLSPGDFLQLEDEAEISQPPRRVLPSESLGDQMYTFSDNAHEIPA